MRKYTWLIEAVAEHAANTPNDEIYHFVEYKNSKWGMVSYTYKDVYDRSLEMAHMLRKKGLKEGDRAIILCMQDFGTIYSVIGCLMAGVVFTIIPPPLDDGKTDRLISVIRSCSPKALISNYALEQESNVHITGRLVREAFTKVVRLKRIYTDQLEHVIDTNIILPYDENRLAYLQYTSGSTNNPKGVRITLKAFTKNIEQCDDCYDFKGGRLATWVPFFHNLGLIVTICIPLWIDYGDVYFLQTLQFLENPKLWIRLMYDFDANLTLAPGSAYDACTRIFTREDAKKYPLTKITHFMNGSEYVNAGTVSRFSEMFALAPNAMAPGYGLAEAVCLATFASQDYRTVTLDYTEYEKNRVVFTDDTEHAKVIASVGKPVKDLTVVIANPKTKKPYGDLKIGEVFVSGDSVADGYWGAPPEDKNFHNRIAGYPGEFYRTGDLGFMYNGHLYLTGRIKEMMIVNGHNIFPNDIQALIAQKIPSMAAASMGFFSYNDGTRERIVALVETNAEDDFRKKAAQINKAVSDRFGFSFYDIVFVPKGSIPRTDNSKLQMIKAREMYVSGNLKIFYSSHAYRVSAPKQNIVDKSIDAADDIMMQVQSVFEKVLGIEQYSITDSFLELGGDSLMGYELVNKIEEKFHIKLDMRDVLADSSVAGITAHVRSALTGQKRDKKPLDLKKDCRLEENIRVTDKYELMPGECRKIFLTGGTGFLGAQLIRAIIRQYPKDGLEIFCLVRASSKESGMERIVSNMDHYHCWKEDYRQYIRPVLGDLSSHHLGISDEEWSMLSENMEAVFHSGALLNFIFPYEYLKETNVKGTAETIRLACAGKPKYYHYVSSYSVYGTPNNKGKRVYENDKLNTSKGFTLAYSQTKWVSEKLVGIAQKRGLRTVIYRPGDITGSSNGIWEMEDMVSRMIVSVIQMEAAPMINYQLHMTPVDYVAKSIAYISQRKECVNHAFNIINPKPQPLTKIVSCIRECGYTVHYVLFPVWRARLRQADVSENAMVLLESLFELGSENNPSVLEQFVGKPTIYDMSNTNLLLNQSGISCPEIDIKMMKAYLRYFRKLGCI